MKIAISDDVNTGFLETIPFLGESAQNDYFTMGEKPGRPSEAAEDRIRCRTILYASRFSSMPTTRPLR
jgi:hypothetical protein